QKYIGPARWPFLADVVRQYGGATGFVLGGSGDIWCAEDVPRMLHQTGVQLVSVARGCIGNPWIFRQVRALLAGDAAGAARAPSVAEQREVLLEHAALSIGRHGEGYAGPM